MTELSIGEIDSLVLKAYRGAGFSWGLSQEAGRAAAWMAMRGLPAAKCFAELLQQTDGLEHATLTPEIPDGNWSNVRSLGIPSCGSAFCPIIVGTMLSDFGWISGGELTLGSVYSSLIMIPFVSACAESAGIALCVNVGEESFLLMANGQLASGFSDYGFTNYAFNKPATVIVSAWKSADERTEFVAPLLRRVPIADAAMAQLESLAHRTYVPASEQSRSGAGAGLTDND